MIPISKYYKSIVLFLITASICSAQFSNIKFDRITVKEGLSQSTVTSIVKDSLGFMWFGTYEGLNRYDGYNFKVYKVEDKPSNGLSNNFIKDLLVDSKGDLWVATTDGLNLYDQKKDKFISFKNDEADNSSISGNDIPCIIEDKKGDIWIGTFRNGLNKFNRKDSTFTRFVKEENNLNAINDNSVQSLYEDKKGNLWIGTVNGGLNKFDWDKNKFIHYTHYEKNINTISGNNVHDITEDINGTLVLSVWEKGIDFFDTENETFAHKYFDYILYDIKFYNNNSLLIGTRNNGLLVYNTKDDKINSFKNISGITKSISSNSVYTIYIDNIGTAWLGTSGGGINKFNPRFQNFTVYQNDSDNRNSLSNNYILSIIEDRNNNLWVGTRGGGLNFYNPNSQKWIIYKHDSKNPNSISDDIISSLLEDAKGNIWIGTETGGLNKYNPATKTFKKYKHDPQNPNSIRSDWVTDIHEDKEGILWLSTFSGGLNRFDPQSETFTAYLPEKSNPESISGEALTKLYEDNENNIWIGTFGYGLNKFNKKDKIFTQYKNNKSDSTSISINYVLCAIRSKSGTVWIGTTYGLNRLNVNGTFTNITVYDGLPSNGVYGILEDDSGFLWMSTNDGLVKYNPIDKSIKVYDESDGLPGSELNFGPAFKSRNGKMYFGGPNGFFYFHPDSLKKNDYLPPVVFTEFTILNKPALVGENISAKKRITLNYDDKIFSLTFAALNYIQSSENKYAYKLEGFSDDWIELGTERKVTFTNLDPGDYTLRVKASNNDGLWNEHGTSLAITIIPPYWQSWWFRSIFMIILLSVGPIIYYRRVTALKKEQRLQHEFSVKLINNQEQERSRIAQELHDSLGQELLLIKNRAMLGLKNLEDETKAKKQLEYISDSAASAINQVRHISHNLRPPELDRIGITETMRSIITEINDAGLIKVESEINNIDGMIEKENEINLIRILQEAFSNILKHSGATKVLIKLLSSESIIKLQIVDNGKGFYFDDKNENYAKGLGLRGMNERAAILGGAIMLESAPGNGTKLIMEIPVKHD